MSNVLFRLDSSFTIGIGHIMRDLVLAKQFKDSNIVFAVQDLSGNINDKILESGFKIEILKSNDIDELNSLIKKLRIDMVVIDHYDIGYKQEKQIKKSNPKVKILSFDDTYEKHYCDILLNHNISADSKKYKGLVPKNCELRCGSKYTLLRDEFYIEKKKKRNKKLKKVKSVFVAMGGADTAKLNIPILEILNEFSNIQVNLVTTNANKELKELQEYCKNKKWVNLHINSNKIAKILAQSNISIVTSSMSVNEVYFMRVPFITIKTANNQDDIYKYLKKKKYSTLKKFKKKKLINYLCKAL